MIVLRKEGNPFPQGESRMKPLVIHPPRPILRSKNNENHRNKNKTYR